jgi:hypothetical protein
MGYSSYRTVIMKFNHFILLCCLLALFSCKSPDDQLPQVVSVSVNDSQDSHYMTLAGEELKIHLQLKDNGELKQLMVQLKSQTGMHHMSGESSTEYFKQQSFGSVDTTLLYNLNGQSEQSIEVILTLPDSLLGKCKMTLGLLDNNGNYYNKSFDLFIHNAQTPFLVLNQITPSPADDGIIYISADELASLHFDGQLVDPSGLANIRASLTRNNQIAWEQDWNVTPDVWQFQLNEIQIQEQVLTGRYTLTLEANDIEGWRSIFQGPIQIN